MKHESPGWDVDLSVKYPNVICGAISASLYEAGGGAIEPQRADQFVEEECRDGYVATEDSDASGGEPSCAGEQASGAHRAEPGERERRGE